MGVQLPRAFLSSPEFAPSGGPIKAKALSGDLAHGKLLTSLGHEDWDADQSSLIGRVPAALRAEKGQVSKGNKGTLKPGLDYVQLSADAIASRGLEPVMASLGSHGRIAGMLPEGTVLLYVDAYQVKVRCSIDFSCTSLVGGRIAVPVYSGSGSDSFFGSLASPPDPSVGVLYDPGTGETTLNWWNPGQQAVDLYRGTIDDSGDKGTLATPFYILDNASAGAACFQPDLPGTAAGTGSNYTTGAMTLVTDPTPALGQATYYIVSGNQPGGPTVEALGCANPGGLSLDFPPPSFGCPAQGDPDRIVRQTDAGNLCP